MLFELIIHNSRADSQAVFTSSLRLRAVWSVGDCVCVCVSVCVYVCVCVCALRGVGLSYPKHKPSDPYCRTHLPTGWKLSGGHAGKTRARDGKDLKRGELVLDITNPHTLSHSLPFEIGACYLYLNNLRPGSLSTAKFD